MVWSLLQVGFLQKQPLKSEVHVQGDLRGMLSISLPEGEAKETELGRGRKKSLSQSHSEL